MQAMIGGPALEKPGGSTDTLSQFGIEVIVTGENLRGLQQLNADWVCRPIAQTAHQRVILDMDSSESPAYGEQEEAAYNGHFSWGCCRTRPAQ